MKRYVTFLSRLCLESFTGKCEWCSLLALTPGKTVKKYKENKSTRGRDCKIDCDKRASKWEIGKEFIH